MRYVDSFTHLIVAPQDGKPLEPGMLPVGRLNTKYLQGEKLSQCPPRWSLDQREKVTTPRIYISSTSEVFLQLLIFVFSILVELAPSSTNSNPCDLIRNFGWLIQVVHRLFLAILENSTNIYTPAEFIRILNVYWEFLRLSFWFLIWQRQDKTMIPSDTILTMQVVSRCWVLPWFLGPEPCSCCRSKIQGYRVATHGFPTEGLTSSRLQDCHNLTGDLPEIRLYKRQNEVLVLQDTMMIFDSCSSECSKERVAQAAVFGTAEFCQHPPPLEHPSLHPSLKFSLLFSLLFPPSLSLVLPLRIRKPALQSATRPTARHRYGFDSFDDQRKALSQS